MARALIALSGGVDSSVAAYLMKQAGYDCVGASLRLLDSADTADAKAVAKALDIPFYAFDMREEFKKEIIDEFISSYENGLTPNPCDICNRVFKFGYLYDKAKELGCDYIVTGHYAKIVEQNGEFSLRKSQNTAKDQSYFLYSVKSDMLPKIIFPLEDYSKDVIRKIAADLGFSTAAKKDSQDICFIPNGDYAAVIESLTGKDYKKGDFVDLNGKKLGTHSGIIRYTIGQRKGLGIALGKPMFVGKKDAAANTVTLCDDNELYSDSLVAKEFNWLKKPDGAEFTCKARIRYRHIEQPATVTLEGDKVYIKFNEPQRAITPGQSVVLYDDDMVLGGGIIE